MTDDNSSDGPVEPRFTVMVPSFNSADFVESAVRSALDQLGPADRVLVQDAGSTDGALQVLHRLADEDPRLQVVVEPDGGQSDALNRALARAEPSWVIWLNADDLLLPGAREALLTAMAAHPEGEVFYGGHRILRSNGESVQFFPGREMVLSKLLRQGITSFSGSIVMRDDLLRDLGGFRNELHCAMDYDLQMRIAHRRLRQVQIPAELGALRFHESSKTANLWKGFVRESHGVRMQYSTTPSEKALGLWGTAWHLAEVPFFRMRLSPTYRRLRKRLPAQLR